MKVSMEDADNGGQKLEVEIEIYAKVVDITSITASGGPGELQEQWGVYIPKTDKNNASGNMRVRYSSEHGYIFTSKVKLPNANDEEEFPVNENLMKHLRLFAESGLIKTRYKYPVPETELVLEVDVFEGPNGISKWVKVDIELPDGVSPDVIPDLPFETEEIRVIMPGQKNESDLAFVRKLFDEEYNVRYNPEHPSTESLNVYEMYQDMVQ